MKSARQQTTRMFGYYIILFLITLSFRLPLARFRLVQFDDAALLLALRGAPRQHNVVTLY